MSTKLAYLGPPGTFGEEAALLYNQSQRHARLVPLPSHAAVATAIVSGMADDGVMAIENSMEGSVNETLDTLIQNDRLRIRHELVLPIRQNLLVRPGVETAAVKVIYSHTQALGQCRGFLERCFPKAQLVAALSTTAAVEQMLASAEPAAAIGTGRAAELYKAEVLARDIQGNPNNVTRFVIVALSDSPRTGRDKTSIAFSFSEDKPGQLYGVLGEFAQRTINLAKVESRPAKLELGKYYFLVDLEGHREDPPVRDALEAVRRRAGVLKVFGSYPRYQSNG
ncbi:MAG: prephenate dehydratase [Chloroflexi bacterium]|nr:prephenate dehydratase [Chloroflexota bacterium]